MPRGSVDRFWRERRTGGVWKETARFTVDDGTLHGTECVRLRGPRGFLVLHFTLAVARRRFSELPPR